MENKQKYNKVLSLALEIEGLAVLLQRRGDLINPEIHAILEEKIKALAALVTLPETEKNHTIEMSPTDVESQGTEMIAAGAHLQPSIETELTKIDQIVKSDIREVEKTDEMQLAEAVMIEQEEDSDPAIEIESEEAPEHFAAEEPKQTQFEINEIDEKKEIEEPKENEGNLPSPPPAPNIDPTFLMKAFTLNDRFRFRRSLFNDNDDEFKNALLHLSQMTSEEEIEEYLIDDLCFDLENEDTRDFYNIITAKLIEK